MRYSPLAVILCASQGIAAPIVMTDIAPIQGITAAVMGDLGQPDVLVPQGADAHGYALRPSDAARLNDADVMIWVGAGLTPWLEKSVTTLGGSAAVLELLDTSGWTPRAIAKADDHEDDGHDNHADHDNNDDHDSHDDHSDHDTHDHGDIDPHAWLNPSVAAVWADHIAAALSTADPDNADTYAANARAFGQQLEDLDAKITTALAPYDGTPLIWPHDAYGYFADAFPVASAGSIADASARQPGPAHIAELRDIVAEQSVGCVLTDAEIGPKWATLVRDGSTAGTAAIDPLGADAPMGADHYTALMTNLATAIATCQAN